MKFRYIYKVLFLLLILPLVAFSCDNEDDPVEPGPGRTVLVYIMGENSLNNFVEKDIVEMESAINYLGKNDNLILFIDKKGSTPQIIKLEKNSSGQAVRTEIRKYTEEFLSIDPGNMIEVFKFVFGRFPADSYGLVLWSHGDGWIPDYTPRNSISPAWIGQDGGNAGPKMNIPELVTVLDEFPKFEFIFFDACFMQSVEVAYELRHYANYMIGSATETPGPGAPYQFMIQPMFERTFNVSKLINDYYAYYAVPSSEWAYGAAISAIKCDELEQLAAETAKILPLYKEYLDSPDLSEIQRYDRRSACLYYDFNSFIKSFVSEEEYALWKKQLDKVVPYKETTSKCYSAYISGTFSIDQAIYSGISTYVMRDSNSFTERNEYYKELSWYTDAGWSQTNW